MKVTEITPQKRNKSFYNIYIDHEYFCSLDDETIHKMELKEGMDVNTELLIQASEESSYKKAFNYALSLLAKCSKTKHEIAKKLKEKEYKNDTIEAAISRLIELGYLNDEQYAEAYIRSKQAASQGLNKRILYNKLLQKGIDKELIRQCLENSEIDEFQSALQAAEKKLRSLKENDKDKKSKLYKFLLYKGFSYEICTKVLNNFDYTE